MTTLHPAEQYIADVQSGAIPACKLVKLAVQRHLDDLATGAARGLHFDPDAAQHAIDFVETYCHQTKAEWMGQPLTLQPWQQFMFWCLFGWMKADGYRRFQTAYIEIPRRNGKSVTLSAIGNYMFIADGEGGADCYSAATDRKQARIIFDEAKKMVQQSPEISALVEVLQYNMSMPATFSKFEPLPEKVMHGLNVHFAAIDELHEHKNRDCWDTVVSSCSNRKQPLVVAITTAGTASSFICREQREYARQILTGALPTNESTDSYFGLIYTLDTRHDWPELVERKDGEPLQAGVAYEDDWRDEATWIKANPSLDVCKEREKLRIAVQQAQEVKGLEFSTLRLEFNVWTQSETRWLSQLHWNACGVHPVRIQELLGRECYAGLDLSTRNDLTAFVLVFPPEQRGGPYAVLPYFWIPADRINYRVRKDHVPYDVWARDGQLIATPGNEIDFQFVEAQIAAASQQYKIVEIAYDRYEATMLSQRLRAINSNEEWVVPFGQGYASMSPASKNLETCIIGGELAHGNHPILTWMANNVVIEMDAAGNIKPSKAKSTERIDGIVALIMGLDRAIRHGGKKTVDVYQRRGPIFV